VNNLGENALLVLLNGLAVLVPILLAVWVMRTLSAMVEAQREIAAHLASINTSLREGIKPPVI
jgi:F0F1-type ATP synthase membrane subunit b/b'